MRLVIHIERDRDARFVGSVGPDGAASSPFSGVLQLLARLEDLLDECDAEAPPPA